MYVLDQNKKNRFYYIKVGFRGWGINVGASS